MRVIVDLFGRKEKGVKTNRGKLPEAKQVILICTFTKPKSQTLILGDVWRIAEEGIQVEKDSLCGLPTISKKVETLPKELDENVFNDIQKMASVYCLPSPSSNNVYYTVVSDRQTNNVIGVAYVIRQTPIGVSEARRHNGVVLRCARCGEAPGFATREYSSFFDIYRDDHLFHLIEAGIMRAPFFRKIVDYFLCQKCQNEIGSSLQAVTPTIATCWCGYRFLNGWAEWYFRHKDTARCPNCGIELSQSGAAFVNNIGSVIKDRTR